MLAKLPDIARVKSWSGGGERPLKEIQGGEQVIGYNTKSRELVVLTLRKVSPVPAEPVMALFLQSYRWCYFFGSTLVFTLRGMIAVANNPGVLMSYCVVNPKRMVPKVPVDAMEQAPIPGVLIEWDGEELLWAEGLLVGTTNLSN